MFKDSQGRWRHTEEENRKTGKAQKGKYISEETRQKLSRALKGRTVWNKGKHHSEETKSKLSKALKGRPLSEEVKLKMSEAQKGRVITWGDKISEARKGHKVSEGTRLKIGEAGRGHRPWNKNKSGVYSQETLKAMSEANRGQIPWNKDKVNVYSEETLQAIGNASRGRKHTEEEKRKISESNRGKNHWNWQGGKSFKPYPIEFNKQLKELIRNRDNYQCQRCGMPECENMEKLSIHHIDYNKKNCLPSNLISLCRGCNAVVNINREHWQRWFNEKIGVKIENRIAC